MNSIKTNPKYRISIRRIATGLIAVVAGTIGLCTASQAAFAQTVAPPSDGAVRHALTPVQTVVAGGMPGWQIALIAVGAALAASVGAVIVDRARAARRRLAPAAS